MGYIYILTNPSFPQYVKIGYATDVKQRLDELNRSTAVPFAFRVYATYEVEARLSDLKLHAMIDHQVADQIKYQHKHAACAHVAEDKRIQRNGCIRPDERIHLQPQQCQRSRYNGECGSRL